MKHRIAAAVGLTAIVAGLATVPANAALTELESWGAGGTASALQVTLLGQDATFSLTGAEVDSAPQAAADGYSIVSPAFTSDPAPAKQPGGDKLVDTCAQEIDPAEVFGHEAAGVVDIDIACVTSEAKSGDSLSSSATTDEVVIEITTAPAAAAELEPVLEPIEDGIDQILTGLEPVIGPIDQGLQDNLDVALQDLIDDLIDNLTGGATVFRLTLGPSSSGASADDTAITGTAGANGAVIELFPDLNPDGPLLTVTVGASSATVTRDAATGKPTAEAEAAVVTLDASPQLGQIGEVLDQIEAGLGELSAATLPCNAENPLFDLVCVEIGQTEELSPEQLKALGLDFGEGTVGIRAGAARIQVLPVLEEQLGGPGVAISLADAAAAANAVAATPTATTEPPATTAPPTTVAAPPTTAPPTVERTTLPQTGTDIPVGLAAVLAGIAAFGLLAVRRIGSRA